MATSDPVQDPRPPTPALIALCVGTFVAFSLQQVVVGQGLGFNLSLGSMLLRFSVLLCCGLMLWHHGIPRPLRPVALAIGLGMIALAASTLASAYRPLALAFALRYALELLMLWCTLNLALAWPRLAYAACYASLIMLWLGLLLSLGLKLQWPGARALALCFYPVQTLDEYLPRISGFDPHPALFGATAVITLAMILHLRRLRICSQFCLWLAVSGCLLALLGSGARNPLLGLLVLIGAAGWSLRHHRHARRGVVITLFVLGALVAFSIVSRFAQLTSAHDQPLFTAFSLGRPLIWMAAFKAWLSAPWLGLGAGVFQFVIPDFANGRFIPGELHAHNLLLGILSELGLAGLLTTLLLAGALWWPWRRVGSPGRYAALTVLTLLLSFGIFDYYVPFYGFALHGALLLGLLYAQYLPPLTTETTRRST